MNTSGHTDDQAHFPKTAAGRPACLAYSVADAVMASGIGRTTLYGLMNSGQLPFVKLGNRTLIRCADLEQLLDRHVTRRSARHTDEDSAAP